VSTVPPPRFGACYSNRVVSKESSRISLPRSSCLYIPWFFNDASSLSRLWSFGNWDDRWIRNDLKWSGRGLRHYPGICLDGLRKTTKSLSQNNRCPGRYPKRAAAGYDSRALLLGHRSVFINRKESKYWWWNKQSRGRAVSLDRSRPPFWKSYLVITTLTLRYRVILNYCRGFRGL
jgi:hypothetical protein